MHQPLVTAPSVDLRRPQAVAVVLAEADPALLVRCLGALALQRTREGLYLAPEAFGVVLAPLAGAGPVRRALQVLGPTLPFTVRLMPPAAAEAWALRAALAAAGDWLGGRGAVLLTGTRAVP
ncbi:hypothetical protein E2C05_32355, partial [Paracraurococcus ruber]|uniref:hypothetical protein n=1 Tax=Paracraurococcus ruber TaxID=77675 RepID=UPI001961CA61